jgi:hypothetical protein
MLIPVKSMRNIASCAHLLISDSLYH